MRKILFLDRDGTLIKSVPYLHKAEEVEWLPGVLSSLKILKLEGWELVVVTNQSGVARGMYGEEDIHKVHQRMEKDLQRFNIKMSDWIYCPHHPDYTGESILRKPAPGMLIQYLIGREPSHDGYEDEFKQWSQENQANLVMVGDSKSDIQAGLAVQADVFYLGGKSTLQLEDLESVKCFESFGEIAEVLHNKYSKSS